MAISREDRLEAVLQLKERHALALECFPEMSWLLPDPHGTHVTHAYWGVCIERARSLLHALGHHDAEELRATFISCFDVLLRREPLLQDLLPHRITSAETFMSWRLCVLKKIVMFTSMADLAHCIDVRLSSGETQSNECRYLKRQFVFNATADTFADVMHTYPRARELLPDPVSGPVTKRPWEHAMWRARVCLRVVRDQDRTAAHNFALREFRDYFQERPHLRDLLPDPADDMESDEMWAVQFLDAVLVLQSF